MPEKTMAELSSEHHKLIRESPEYRNFLMLLDLQAEMEPPLYQPDEPKVEEPGELVLSQYLTQKTGKLGELEGQLIHIHKDFHEHISYSKERKQRTLYK